MAANPYQKVAVIDINTQTEANIQAGLAAGYVIQQIVSLLPTYPKLVVIYSTPDFSV